MAQIKTLHRFPLKGFEGETLPEAELRVGVGIVGDRQLAFRFADAPSDAKDKRHFVQQSNTPAIAALQTSFDEATEHLRIRQGGEVIAEGRGFRNADKIAQAMSRWRQDQTGEDRALVLERARFPDVPDCDLSLLLEPSLDHLAWLMNIPLDERRFRMNVLLDGPCPPFEEWNWVGKDVQLGSARLTIMGRLPRCPGPETSPATGRRDIEMLHAMREHLGHVDLGVLARVRTAGIVRPGDRLALAE